MSCEPNADNNGVEFQLMFVSKAAIAVTSLVICGHEVGLESISKIHEKEIFHASDDQIKRIQRYAYFTYLLRFSERWVFDKLSIISFCKQFQDFCLINKGFLFWSSEAALFELKDVSWHLKHHYRTIAISLKESNRRNYHPLEGILALNGCGDKLFAVYHGYSMEVNILLVFPQGVERTKTREELKELRLTEREQRIEHVQSLIEKKQASTSLPRKWNNIKRKINPATEFKIFLLHTYGRELLNSGLGILDVAGGKGELGFKLVSYGEIDYDKCHIVDPRPMNLKGMLKAITKDHILRHTSSQKKHLLIRFPNHLQCWFTGNSSGVSEILSQESRSEYVDDKLDHSEIDNQMLEQILHPNDRALRISLLIGLHPDQATEYIVDYGLTNNIPFAVIPCCVFQHSSLFKHRKEIKSYEEFLNFLRNKAPSKIRMATLPFPGRNTVLYTVG